MRAIPRHVQALLGNPVLVPGPGQHQFVYHSMYAQASHGQEVPSIVTASPVVPASVSFNVKYIRTWPGILRIFELISLFAAWMCAMGYKGLFHLLHLELSQRVKLFLGLSLSAWVLVILVVTITLKGCTAHRCGSTTPVLVGLLYALFGVALALSSGLLTEHIIYKLEASQRSIEATGRSLEFTMYLYAAVVFGFLSSFLLAMDSVLFCARLDAKISEQPAIV